jgi:predicted regulator of Ras-like GTPase activity (Roadblock/LC7/MglB family)
MRLLPIAIAAAAATLMIAPSANAAMDKMDGDAMLKMIFHGKPGSMMMMPPMAPMAPMATPKEMAKAMGDMTMMRPWDMMKKPMKK